MKFSSAILAGVLLALAVPTYAQSLGDLAKKEQARRKTTPPPAKTYTNEDLKKLPPSPDATGDAKAVENLQKDATGTPKAADDSRSDPAKAADAGKADAAKAAPPQDEAFWRGRITAAHEEVRRNEMFREALQVRINSLASDFAGRDDPAQRAQIADDRQKALAELARVTLDIEKATKQIADIEEEARRAGVPPGWIR